MVNVLAKKAVLARLSISRWGARRLEREVTRDVVQKAGANADAGIFTKRLLPHVAMKEINSICTAASAYHFKMTLPWLDDGVRILPSALYLDYAKAMQKYFSDFDTAVSVFVEAYPKLIQGARKELGTLFEESDYPEAEIIYARFRLQTIILPCPDKDDFRAKIDPEHLKDIKANLDEHMQEQIKGTVSNIATRITERVGHMAERLKAYKPANTNKGTKAENKFHDSLIENVRELAELLPAFNLSDDPELSSLIARIKDDLCPHEPEALRTDAKLRKKVAMDANQILAQVSEYLA